MISELVVILKLAMGWYHILRHLTIISLPYLSRVV